ncbi:hypothetical protein VPH35_087876 [Triticum aestivum]
MGRVCRWLRKGGSSLTWSSMRSFWMSPAPAILEGKGCDKRRRRCLGSNNPSMMRSKASWWCIGAGGGGGPVLFVLKTYEMVDSPSTEAAVWWSDALDTTFVVWCSLEFASSSTEISPVSSMSSPPPSLTESLRTPSNQGQVCADLGFKICACVGNLLVGVGLGFICQIYWRIWH